MTLTAPGIEMQAELRHEARAFLARQARPKRKAIRGQPPSAPAPTRWSAFELGVACQGLLLEPGLAILAVRTSLAGEPARHGTSAFIGARVSQLPSRGAGRSAGIAWNRRREDVDVAQ
jgi:hypothetical protein